MHRKNAHLAIAKAQHYQAKYFNKGRCPPQEIDVGLWVLPNSYLLDWIESKGLGVKLTDQWIGPFEVTEKVNDNTYHLHLGSNYPGGPVFNSKHLKLYKDSPPELGPRTIRMNNVLWGDAEPKYKVEQIISYCPYGRGYQYFVRWAAYGPKEDSWTMSARMQNMKDLLWEYKLKHWL